jgi:hypothetical protein
MANALDEQILALVATKLATITVANGYSQTVTGVGRPPTDLFDVGTSDLPYLIVREKSRTGRWHLRGAEEFELEVEVLCLAATRTAVANLIADVKKCALANEFWNDGSSNLARETTFPDDRVHEVEVDEEVQSGSVRFRVLARASVSDPTATKAI